MDVDKLTVVSDALSDSKDIIIVQVAATVQAGITDGVGVPASPDVPIPPPGDWTQSSAPAPSWFAGALQVTVADCMQQIVIPQLEETIYAAVKRRRDNAYWGGGGPPCWPSNKKKASGQWSSQSSSWQAPSCRMCFNPLQDTETYVWNIAWGKDLKHTADWYGKPGAWYNSMAAHLHSAAEKAVKDRQPKPNYDGATLTLVQSRLERALYDPCKPK